MSNYIGRSVDAINNISTLDNLTFNGSSTTFNLTQNSVAFVPVSADALQIQIDGVIQSGNYTVSGSTVTFDFTPSGSSVCNGIRHYGVGLLTTVSDGAVTNTKLGADSVNGTKIADNSISDEHLDITAITGQTAITSLADTDKFLVSDASDSGNLKYVEKQYLPSGGLVKLANYDVSSTVNTITFDNTISDTYANYLLIASNLFCSSTGQTHINYRVGSSTQSDSNYNNQIQSYNSNSAESNARQNSGANIKPHYDINSTSDSGVSFTTWLYNPRDSQTKRSSTIGAIDNASDYHVTFNSACHWTNSATGVTGIILSRSAGSFYSAGQVTLYGVVK